MAELDDATLVAAAAGAARAVESGERVPDSTVSLLRAIASTRDEQRRHELARKAEEQAALLAPLGAVALQFLRVAIFALA